MNQLDEADLAYFQKAMDGLAQARSIVDFVQGVLVVKYGLRDGDNVELSGRITRIGEFHGEEDVDSGDGAKPS